MITLQQCKQLDLHDPLASIRDQFVTPPDTIYLDGNSLGLSTLASQAAIAATASQQWAIEGIKSWNTASWIDLPLTTGDKIGKLIGAEPGQTICCDSISVNLFKLICYAKQLAPNRTTLVSTNDNFGTDLYIAQGLQALLGEQQLRLVTCDEAELEQHIDDDTLLVIASQVNFKTGALLDMRSITATAHARGAMVLFDLAHSAGALDVQLDHHDIDFAVGCTYKFLNGGPGSPGFAYINKRHQGKAAQPIYGWMGHAQPFSFSPVYTPNSGIKSLLTGTPPIISMVSVLAALSAFDGIELSQVRNKSMAMGNLLIQCVADLDLPLSVASPRNAEHRGSQVSFYHDDAYAICQALAAHGVIADFRAPNILRIGLTPLYTGFADLYNAAQLLAKVLNDGEHQRAQYQVKNAVT